MSNAFAALIWWVVPAVGLIGALGYVVWVTKFEGKFQQETQRSVGKFQRFQDSLRDSQARQRPAVLMKPLRVILDLPMLDLPTRAQINFSTDVYFASFTYNEN
ncbi:MAG: hypothetical protein RJA96_791 [Actinomycetota bacterium]